MWAVKSFWEEFFLLYNLLYLLFYIIDMFKIANTDFYHTFKLGFNQGILFIGKSSWSFTIKNF